MADRLTTEMPAKSALNGQIDVLANSSIYADSAANGMIRSMPDQCIS